jgi:hypothetical protein
MKIGEFFRDMVSDSNGNISTMRMMSWFALGMAMYSGIKLLNDPVASSNTANVQIFALWLIAAFVPKMLQRIAEGPGSLKFSAPTDADKDPSQPSQTTPAAQ